MRGVGPVFREPDVDIVEVIEEFEDKSEEVLKGVENKTEFPLDLPDGFSISILAKDLDKPRVLYMGKLGLLVSIPSKGEVVAIDVESGDVEIIASGLNKPHGLAERCRDGVCKLYIAEIDQVAVYDYDENFKAVNKKKIIDLPGGGGHHTRTIMFMPVPNEDRLLVSVGSTCNVCDEDDWRRAKILSANFDGSDLKEYATGLRNAVFMNIHPVTDDIWVTEMGRDLLGDDLPPDEINIVQEGKFYGWPICYGKNIHDTDFDKNVYVRNPCSEPFEIPSYIDIPAHSAPLGLAFFGEEGWAEEYWYDMLVAYHGSWNRSEPTGYKIVRYRLDENGNYQGKEDFISGWLAESGGALGRPVDVLILPGVIYVSDDKAGVVYRIKDLRSIRQAQDKLKI